MNAAWNQGECCFLQTWPMVLFAKRLFYLPIVPSSTGSQNFGTSLHVAVSNLNMRRRWRLILPACGLLLFSFGSYESFRLARESHREHWRFFYWASIRLDSDPLGRQYRTLTRPCPKDPENCTEFDLEYAWIDPGPLAKLQFLSAMPAFSVGMRLVFVLGKFGINEVISFMILMPLLICAWFYFLGWFIDRWRFKRSLKS